MRCRAAEDAADAENSVTPNSRHSPRVTTYGHRFAAPLTHSWSQELLQQNGSEMHTMLQQARSVQPGPPVEPQSWSALAHAPLPQRSTAPLTQKLSQFVEQQNGSLLHTSTQQVASEQPGDPVVKQPCSPFGQADR